jgi:hypothetical protein
VKLRKNFVAPNPVQSFRFDISHGTSLHREPLLTCHVRVPMQTPICWAQPLYGAAAT